MLGPKGSFTKVLKKPVNGADSFHREGHLFSALQKPVNNSSHLNQDDCDGVVGPKGPLRVGMNNMGSKSGKLQPGNSKEGGDGWSPEVLQTVRVVEGSLWDIQAELMKVKDFSSNLLKIIDTGLELIMGLGRMGCAGCSSSCNKNGSQQMGFSTGPIFVVDRRAPLRPTIWQAKNKASLHHRSRPKATIDLGPQPPPQKGPTGSNKLSDGIFSDELNLA